MPESSPWGRVLLVVLGVIVAFSVVVTLLFVLGSSGH
jgi:F0F1-type ATP synthase assembly protein I